MAQDNHLAASAHPQLQPLDRFDIEVLLDFESDPFSAPSAQHFPSYRSERQQNLHVLSQHIDPDTNASVGCFGHDTICCSSVGFSYVLRLYPSKPSGDATGATEAEPYVILFDAGSGQTTVDNVRKLETDLSKVQEVALSHRHYDHLGGLPLMLQEIKNQEAKQPTSSPQNQSSQSEPPKPPRTITVHAHPEMFVEQGFRSGGSGPVIRMQSVMAADVLKPGNARIAYSTQPKLIAEGAVLWSGEIPRVTEYEKGVPSQVVRHVRSGRLREAAPTDEWQPEPLVKDEAFLMFELKNKGLIVLSACSHAGIVNVVTQATKLAKEYGSSELARSGHIHLVMGGFHLIGADKEPILERTVTELVNNFKPDLVLGGHCSGYKAKGLFRQLIGDRFNNTPTGCAYSFKGQ